MKIKNRLKNKSTFLSVPMVDKSFVVKLDCIYGNIPVSFPVKIDTGCTHSLIPYDRLYGIVDTEAFRDAKKVSMQKYSWGLGMGVETDREEALNINLDTEEDRLNCKNIRVLEPFDNIKIDNNINLGTKNLYVSYDYTCNSLIGMEILKDWDIHISKSLKTGQTMLLACPLNKINQEYIDALIEEFDIGQQVIKKLTDKIDYEALEASCINSKLN